MDGKMNEEHDWESDDFFFDLIERRAKPQMITKQSLTRNKFYIGSDSVLDVKFRGQGLNARTSWGHEELADAIAHAHKMLQEDQEKEAVFIVEIIRVVRRKVVELPIVVEDI